MSKPKVQLEETSRYIGVKIINAIEMNKGKYNFYRGWKIPDDEDPEEEGYLVIYPDGYESWSPKWVFEEAYRKTSGAHMSFGLAIEAMKKGEKVARAGWNGKDMWLWIQEGSEMPYESARNPHIKALAAEGATGTVGILPHIDMWTTNAHGRRAVCIGWLASQTDMLSDDWFIVE